MISGRRRWAEIGGRGASGAHGALILSLVENKPDITLGEIRARLAEEGLAVAISTVWRFFERHGITRKKRTAHAAEQDRPDVVKRRRDGYERQVDLDPERLVFIEET